MCRYLAIIFVLRGDCARHRFFAEVLNASVRCVSVVWKCWGAKKNVYVFGGEDRKGDVESAICIGTETRNVSDQLCGEFKKPER